MSAQRDPVVVAYYKRQHDGRLLGTTYTGGPWHPNLQHGGPPSALLARALEAEAAKQELPAVNRMTVHFFRPVKISALLSYEASTVRRGTKVAHLTASLYEHIPSRDNTAAQRVEVMRAHAISSKPTPVSAPPAPAELSLTPPAPRESVPPSKDMQVCRYGHSMIVHFVKKKGGVLGNGPTDSWSKIITRLVDDDQRDLTPLERVFSYVDSAGGVSFYLPMQKTSFINADTTLNLLRPMEGEWVGMKARTDLAPEFGNGLASAELFDQRGFFGRVAQQQILESRL
jgi:hypothetical protein